tara:strand:+ start:1130 stop:2428 length:1299 start_codon:yes stop_codon:yes gene_type:complete
MGNSDENTGKDEKKVETKTGVKLKISIEYIDIEALNFADYNPRRLTDKQYADLKRSIDENGFVDPILVNKHPERENVIIGGHMRVRVAKDLGYDEVPAVYMNIPLEEERILNVRLNKNTGEFDFDALANHYNYEELIDIGFSEGELLGLGEMSVDFGDNEDTPPEVVENPLSVNGDIYELGGHRLMCGDATIATDVEQLFNGLKPIIMVTDPPYGVEYDPEWRARADLGIGERTTGTVQNDDCADWSSAYALFEGDVAYVYHAAKYTHIVAQNLINCGFGLKAQIIWAKQHFALSRGDYHWQHEPCWYGIRENKTHNWQGKRDQSTLWEIKNNNAFGNSDKEETWGHGTQKPIECMLRPIMNNTRKGQVVYDPFGGSGTTLIACERVSRLCLTMELDEKYCDAIVKRYVAQCKTQDKPINVIRNGEPCHDFS